jgi:hypothetical protein
MGAVQETPRPGAKSQNTLRIIGGMLFGVRNSRHGTRDNSWHGSSLAAVLAATVAAWLCLTASFVSVSAVAGTNDHVVVTKKEQTVKAVIQSVLQSTRFADPIASYNGFDSIATVLPLGTTVRIPKPYIEVLNFGQIAFVKGDVTLAKSDVVVNPPGKGALVHNGDIIRTGESGFVSVSFHSGAQFNLQPGSVVQVNNVRCLEPTQKCVIELDAQKGSVSSEIQPRPDGEPPVEFSVTTPFLSAAVRGTVFYVDVEDEINRIGVTRGLVAADSAGTQVDLPKGKGMAASASSPPQEVNLLPEPVFAGVERQTVFSREDAFSWSAIDGADAYLVKLASDPAIAEIDLMSEVETTDYTADLRAGDYFLSVAALDASDFVGLPLIKPVRFAEITEDAQPELKIERREGVVTLQLAGDSAEHSGPVELIVSKSIDDRPEDIQIIENLSQPLTLELAEDQTWVFRVRKLIGPYAVSAYSNHYQLSAR